MAEKNNPSAEAADLTSYTFAKGCGICHPGGGPLEYDRNGNRYDEFAANPENNIISGGDNNFDGDYHQAKWAESGVVEADCLLCHLRDYDDGKRNGQLQSLNFRWSATAGAGFAEVKGTVAKGESPSVSYNLSLFDENGKVTLPILREVQNKNCLFCHRESDWKKAGASFQARSDVHTRAGVRCADCHVTARKASDSRIVGRDIHQFGKGDNPDGFGRNDLDNSMRNCQDCHLTGNMNAPIIKHRGLPPSHFEKIACQTCHIPMRQVKPIAIQDSTVFNPGARIPDPKKVWSFYGPDIKPFNFTGEGATYPDDLFPLFSFKPAVGWYKGKLYPLNRAYTIWMGIQTEGKSGLNQVFMKELFGMWKKHFENPETVFPKLKEIKDDNHDGLPEINRPEEIQAVISEVAAMLNRRGRLSQKDKVVFVDGNQYTADGIIWQTLTKEPYETSPYAVTFKLSHDITRAKNALGAGSCNDCHSTDSDFFFKDIMVKPFDLEGKPVYQKNFELMGYSPFALKFMIFHHQVLKPVAFSAFILMGIAGIFYYVICIPRISAAPVRRFHAAERLLYFSVIFLFGVQIIGGLMTFSAVPFSSDTLGKIGELHQYSGYALFIIFLPLVSVWYRKASDIGQKIFVIFLFLIVTGIAVTGLMIRQSSDVNFKLIANGLIHDVFFIVLLMFLAGLRQNWVLQEGKKESVCSE